MTTCPASTWLPSLTMISPTMPPLECCTFLMLDSTTIVPGAITAPASSWVTAHPPIPPNMTKSAPKPIRLSLRMTRRGSRLLNVIARSRCH
jgi:hypothetical protein